MTKARLGGNYRNQERETEFPLMKMGNVGRGRFDVSKVEYTAPGACLDPLHRLALGDVIFNTRNTLDLVGKVAIWRDELPIAYYNSNLMRLEFASDEICSNEYANYFLNTTQALAKLRAIATGTTSVAAIYYRDLATFPFAVPPCPEQLAIARVLDDASALIAALDRVISKKLDLKQATMQQLLTARTRLPGYHGEWKVKPLGELFTFSGGYPASRAQLSDAGYCYLHYGDVHAASKPYINVDLDRLDIPKLDVQLAEIPAAAMLKDGDVVFVDASEDEIGASKHIVVVNRCGTPFISGLHTIIAKSKSDELATEYRRYCFQTDAVREQFSFYIAGTKVFSISKSNIAKLMLHYPSDHAEQRSIAAVLSNMDEEIEAFKLQRDKAKNLNAAIGQKLLMGRTRLATRDLVHA